MNKSTICSAPFLFFFFSCVLLHADDRPNILFAISDDQSFPHASAYDCQFVKTPAFDRVAERGVLFVNAFAPSPGCSPSRASILTGRFPWQNEHAGTHASMFSNKFATYPRLLKQAGYHVGSTGKGWGPGNFKDGGFKQNPAGKPFNVSSKEKVPNGVRKTDYAASFERFLESREDDQPFCFWYGASEPHRQFGKGIGKENGGDPQAVDVPAFLPDVPEIRSDLLDYGFEIEWFDSHLGRMLDKLEEIGELENTIVVVSSDNGMAFPRAKANLYDHGFHVPLAISWPKKIPPGRRVNDVVSLVDLMPTYLEITGVQHPGDYPMAGRSLMPTLAADASGLVDASRTHTFSARERHSSSRWNNLAYPQRCIRTERYLYVRNFRADRWPAGAPQKLGAGNYPGDTGKLGPMHAAYHDIDACPTFDWMIANRKDRKFSDYFALAVAKRPIEELFDIQSDPGCVHNLSNDPKFSDVRDKLARQLVDYLKQTNDPRAIDGGDIFETYKRYSRIRNFPRPKAVAITNDDGFQAIFNGQDFSGWYVSPEKSASDWSVQDGVIVGAGTADRLSYLVWKKEIANFELKLSYRMATKGNTGVEIRSRIDKTGKRPFEGYHADLGHADIGPHIHGAWDFHFAKRKEYPCPRGTKLIINPDGTTQSTKLAKALTPDDMNKSGWNKLHVTAVGNRFSFRINGKVAAEFTDHHPEMLKRGLIGLQIHDKGMRVEFKNIRLKQLP